MGKRARIVVLGAGYGGLCAAHSLQKLVSVSKADIVIVDRNAYHVNTIDLHEVAMGNALTQDITFDILPVLSKPHVRFSKGEVLKVDKENKRVETSKETIPYDFLVLALGFVPETFGIAGMAENAHQIYTTHGCEDINIHLEDHFRKYAFEPHIDRDPKDISILVGGSGFTGIELLGELVERVDKLCKKYKINRKSVHIDCVSADKALLPMFDPNMVDYIRRYLESKGVVFHLNARVTGSTQDSFLFKDAEGSEKELKAGTLIWTGGVSGNPLMHDIFDTQVRRGRVSVMKDLTVEEYPEIYVIGDCSAFIPEGQERPLPTTAQAATQMGHHTAVNISRQIVGRPRLPFEYDYKGTVCSLGSHEGAADLHGRVITGFLSMRLKRFVEAYTDYRISGLKNALKYNRLLKLF